MDSSEQTVILSAKEIEKRRKHNYYINHRDKIEEKRKMKTYPKGIALCKEKGFPDELVECLYKHLKSKVSRKYKKDLLTLNFDHTADLIYFIIDIKFKTPNQTREKLSAMLDKFEQIKHEESKKIE